jgi:hypothetical protein
MISSRQRLLVWKPCTPRLETRATPTLLAYTNSGIALHRPNSRCCHSKISNTSKERARPSQLIRGLVKPAETIKSRHVRGNLCSSSNSSATFINLPFAAASSLSLVSERGSVDDCLGLTKVKYRRGLILAMKLGRPSVRRIHSRLTWQTNRSAVCRGKFCRDDKLGRGGADSVGDRTVGVYAVPSTS